VNEQDGGSKISTAAPILRCYKQHHTPHERPKKLPYYCLDCLLF